MRITERILNGVRDLLRQQDKIDSLTEAVKELTTELRRLDTEAREMGSSPCSYRGYDRSGAIAVRP